MTSNLPYIPVVFKFIPAVISDSNTVAKVYNNYKLLIIQESSSNYSTYQTLPQQYVITVPSSGLVKLKLLLLDKSKFNQQPINRYRVHYYVDSEMIDSQFWVIPNVQLTKQTITVNHVSSEDPITLPTNIYDIESIKPEVEYSLIDNLLYFDNSAPLGEYLIQYQPGLSLHDIVVPK